MKKYLALAVFLILVFGLIVTQRTLSFESKQLEIDSIPAITLNDGETRQRLAHALTFRTISHQDAAKVDSQSFLRFHGYLKKSFPRVHQQLKRHVINEHSLLYVWEGSNPELKPAALMAHQDVVPIEPGTEAQWEHPPFAGKINGGYVWGRGAMDDKSSLLAILEAVEWLLDQQFKPERTFYLAFGHDEEVGGSDGAAKIVDYLKADGKELAFVHDEGLFISHGVLPSTQKPVALVAITEKGYLSLELSVKQTGGHSSVPPRESVIGILSTAVHRLQNQPFPGSLKGPARSLFEYLGPELPLEQKIMYANLWLFRGLVETQLAASPKTDAMLRTTTAPTIIHSGVKENSLPSHGKVVINFRIVPGETIESVTERVRAVINDPRVAITPLRVQRQPSPVSGLNAQGFNAIHRATREVFPDTVVVPTMLLGGSDAYHFSAICPNIYRFQPLTLTPEDVNRFHGTNERIAVENYAQMIRFYIQLIRHGSSSDMEAEKPV